MMQARPMQSSGSFRALFSGARLWREKGEGVGWDEVDPLWGRGEVSTLSVWVGGWILVADNAGLSRKVAR